MSFTICVNLLYHNYKKHNFSRELDDKILNTVYTLFQNIIKKDANKISKMELGAMTYELTDCFLERDKIEGNISEKTLELYDLIVQKMIILTLKKKN